MGGLPDRDPPTWAETPRPPVNRITDRCIALPCRNLFPEKTHHMFSPICVKILHGQSVDTRSKSVKGWLLLSYVQPHNSWKTWYIPILGQSFYTCVRWVFFCPLLSISGDNISCDCCSLLGLLYYFWWIETPWHNFMSREHVHRNMYVSGTDNIPYAIKDEHKADTVVSYLWEICKASETVFFTWCKEILWLYQLINIGGSSAFVVFYKLLKVIHITENLQLFIQ